MQVLQKKSLLSVELIPLWTGLSDANKSTLLLRWRDVASIAKIERLLHADIPTVCVQHLLPVLHSCRDDGWDLGHARGPVGPPVPVLSKDMVSDWQWEEQTSEGPACQLPARLLPWVLNLLTHARKSITDCVHVTLQRWHLHPRKGHDCRFTLPVWRVTSAQPK